MSSSSMGEPAKPRKTDRPGVEIDTLSGGGCFSCGFPFQIKGRKDIFRWASELGGKDHIYKSEHLRHYGQAISRFNQIAVPINHQKGFRKCQIVWRSRGERSSQRMRSSKTASYSAKTGASKRSAQRAPSSPNPARGSSRPPGASLCPDSLTRTFTAAAATT